MVAYPAALAGAVDSLRAVLRSTMFESDDGDAVICLHELDSALDSDQANAALAESLADLVMYVCQGLVEAAEPDEWRGGGAVSAMVWRGLLAAADDRIPELQFWIGECLAWWHEFGQTDVEDAARPSPSASIPAVDSLSLLTCEPNPTLRAVQAKTTLGAPRAQCLKALKRFRLHQRGCYDDAWNDSLRLYRAQLRDRGIDLDVTAHYGSAGKRHFGIAVVMAQRGVPDPVRDYSAKVEADARHGRALVLFHIPGFTELIHAVRAIIHARIA